MCKWLIALFLAVMVLLTPGTNTRQPFSVSSKIPLRAGLSPTERLTVDMNQTNLAQALIMYSELTGRTQLPKTSPISQQVDEMFGGYLSHCHLVKKPLRIRSGIEYHRDGLFSVGEVKDRLEALFVARGLILVSDGRKYFRAVESRNPPKSPP
jgi:hypothetical protein